MLGNIALPVKLTPPENISASGAPERGDAALLLSDKPDKNGEVAVLMRAGSFMQTQNLQMHVRDKEYLLSPSRFVEGGKDFDWAHFKVSKQN